MDEPTRKTKIHRGFARRSASAKFKVTCHKNGSPDVGLNLASVVLDLSEAGARLLVTAPLDVGQQVVLGLEGPSYQQPVRRHGTIVWSFQVTKGAYAVGVRLDEHLGGEDIQQVTIPPVRLDY
jgi:hypothetical protein